MALLIIDIPYEETTLQDFIALLLTEFAKIIATLEAGKDKPDSA